MHSRDPSERPEAGGCFRTTRWSVIFEARESARESLETLCTTYWPPIYAYLRRAGHMPMDAEDLTQSFFQHLLEHDFLKHLKHREGKFRSFLLTFLKYFLSDVRSRANAQRRGGGRSLLSLDQLAEEEQREGEPRTNDTPEAVFERRWAELLLRRAAAQLEEEYNQAGKGDVFQALKDLEPGDRAAGRYRQIGAILGLSEAGVKSAVHRMRLRQREVLRREIARTVSEPGQIDSEITYFIQILSR
jgi:RNA polymerase sigma factor (sigma-70 family)